MIQTDEQGPQLPARLSEEDEALILQQTREIKKHLKMLSKNQLVQLLMQHVNLLTEQKAINKILLDRVKAAEGEQK